LINSLLNEIRPYQQFLNIDSVARAPGGVPVFCFLQLKIGFALKKSLCLCFVSQISECKEKKHIMIVLILRFLLLLPTVKASMHDVACLCKKKDNLFLRLTIQTFNRQLEAKKDGKDNN
jgi:hypothetical protein